MRSTIVRSIFAASCLGTAAAQYAFKIPNPDVADFDPWNDSQQNNMVSIAWIVNTTYQPTISGNEILDSNGNISVWLTSFESLAYTYLVTPSVNSKKGGLFSFNLSISNSDIDTNHGKFVYRLKTSTKAGATFTYDEDECPSRGFTVKKAVAASVSSSSVSATATATQASASASQSAASTTGQGYAGTTNTASPTSLPNKSNGLSGGAIAGIVIGVVGLAAILALAAFIMFRRRRQQHAYTAPKAGELADTGMAPAPGMAPVGEKGYSYGHAVPPQYMAPVEMADGRKSMEPVEMPVSH